jgi:putative holliday junction resolvase
MSVEGRILGIDPGRSRMGLAISDPLGLIAQGLDSYLRGQGSVFDHLAALIEQYGVVHIVVGYPLNMDGSEGDSARAASQFCHKLQERFGLEVTLQDERLTTVEARRAFPPGSKKDWDRIAAMFILQTWLDTRGYCGEGG